jgi:FkbM family methyltransferase
VDAIALSGPVGSASIQYSILKASAAVLRWFGYRGLRRVCRFIAPLFPSENSAIIPFRRTHLKVYLNDDYWVRYALVGACYEAEVKSVLDELLDHRSVFLDCGANIGFWSVYAGAKVGSSDRVVAAEPSLSTFARLVENSELNGRSFATVRKALYSCSGETLQFRVDPAHHDSNGVVRGGPEALQDVPNEPVDSTTVDDLFEQIPLPDAGLSTIVVKLDVEGSEREAFKGARDLVRRGAVFIYEDHGSDSGCKNTEFILGSGLDVYFLDSGMPPVRIRNLNQLAALKTCPTRGYNLVTAQPGSPAMTRLLTGLTLGRGQRT